MYYRKQKTNKGFSFLGTVAIWNKKSGDWECSVQLEGHENEVKCAAFSRSGLFLATCSRKFNDNLFVKNFIIIFCSK